MSNTARHVIEATPAAIAVTAGPVFGFAWPDIAAMLGCFFLLLQMGYLLWRWRRDIKREGRGQAPADTE